MSALNFSEFSPISAQQWREKIITDLKGRAYESLLVSTPENIRIRPDYHPDNPDAVPQKIPMGESKSWKINRVFDAQFPDKANTQILQSFDEGIDSVELKNFDPANLNRVLKGILPQHIQLLFGDNDSAILIDNLKAFCTENNFDIFALSGTLGYNPSGEHQPTKLPEDEVLKNLIESTIALPDMRLFNVSADRYANSGCTLTQELGIALAAGHEYLLMQIERDAAVAEAAANIHFTFATGTDYFMEIAKYRAFRLLWNTIVSEYKSSDNSATTTTIHARTNVWSYTLFDRHNNLLRATTQVLSAALGGSQTITVVPFDAITDIKDKTSDRLAKNIQVILKEEAFIDKVTDPAAGSWYVENLTEKTSEEAWQIFKQIERKGGFIKASESGLIDKMIQETKDKKFEAVAEGKTTILGVNKYLNPDEDRGQLSGNVTRLSEQVENKEMEGQS